MDGTYPLVTLSGLPVETVAVLSILVFGNLLPLGLIVWMFWYAARRHEMSRSESPRPILSRRAKHLRQAA